MSTEVFPPLRRDRRVHGWIASAAVSQAGDTDPAFGPAATARLYRKATGDRRYDAFGQQQLDWNSGANAWGVSFMVGVGRNEAGRVSRSVDDVRSWRASEPADDFAAIAVYALTR